MGVRIAMERAKKAFRNKDLHEDLKACALTVVDAREHDMC